LAEGKTRTISLAPEAGSERLRRLLNKGISEDDILKAVDQAAEEGLSQLKLYFMIGLPTEGDEDIDELIKLFLTLKALLEKRRADTHITLNIAPFVPKAGTPFQWLSMTSAELLEQRLLQIKKALGRKGIEIRAESVEWSLVQGVLARGDSKLGIVLANMPENSLSGWRHALTDLKINPEFYTYEELPLGEPLPWAKVDSGVKPEYLKFELAKAWRNTETFPCPLGECHECGVC
jgi:radical SAM superfamily enzyme YgiQ (UPF0313 family)